MSATISHLDLRCHLHHPQPPRRPCGRSCTPYAVRSRWTRMRTPCSCGTSSCMFSRTCACQPDNWRTLHSSFVEVSSIPSVFFPRQTLTLTLVRVGIQPLLLQPARVSVGSTVCERIVCPDTALRRRRYRSQYQQLNRIRICLSVRRRGSCKPVLPCWYPAMVEPSTVKWPRILISVCGLVALNAVTS